MSKKSKQSKKQYHNQPKDEGFQSSFKPWQKAVVIVIAFVVAGTGIAGATGTLIPVDNGINVESEENVDNTETTGITSEMAAQMGLDPEAVAPVEEEATETGEITEDSQS